MDQTETLTIEDIDSRIVENSARLEVIAGELEKQTAELGSNRWLKLPTALINKAIDRLEHERRELTAEQDFLKQERQNIEMANAQKIAEAAAAEYNELREQINPRNVEIIKGICTLLSQLLEVEKIQAQMDEKAIGAGKLVNTIPTGLIVIQTERIGGYLYRVLSQITSINGKEIIQESGIDITDWYEERERVFGAFHAAVGLSEGESKKPALSTDPARRAAGLPDELPESKSDSGLQSLRKAAGLPVE